MAARDAAQGRGQRLGVQHRQPGHRPGQRDVEPVQAAGLRGGDPGWLDDDDLVELKALGERNRHQGELPGSGIGVEHRMRQAGPAEHCGKLGHLIVGSDHRGRAWPVQGVGAGRRQDAGQRAVRRWDDHQGARVLPD